MPLLVTERELRERVAELERLLADRDRQIAELRAAIEALMRPDFVMDRERPNRVSGGCA